ncbi:MAG: hypothetical protein ACHP9Z_23960, partial [Streptosporangiales bacterium]
GQDLGNYLIKPLGNNVSADRGPPAPDADDVTQPRSANFHDQLKAAQTRVAMPASSRLAYRGGEKLAELTP